MSNEDPAAAEIDEDQSTKSGENEDPKTTDATPSTEGTEKEKEVKLIEDEPTKKKEVELEDDKQPHKKDANEKRTEIVDAYAEKLKDPDFDQEKVPKWVLKDLGIGEGDPAKVAKPKADKNEFSSIEKWEAKKLFDNNKSLLKSLPLKLRNELTEKANELRTDLNVPTAKALNRVLREAEGNIEKELGHAANRKTGSVLPKASAQTTKGVVTEESLSELSQADYNKTMEKVDKGELKIQQPG